MTRNQKGFTLVEIAIVLVIIGLLIGGVLKGQAMIQNAKVKRVVKSADELRAAVYTFYDKYGVYPGDENLAAIPPGDTHNGNGNGTDCTAAEAAICSSRTWRWRISFLGILTVMARTAFPTMLSAVFTRFTGRTPAAGGRITISDMTICLGTWPWRSTPSMTTAYTIREPSAPMSLYGGGQSGGLFLPAAIGFRRSAGYQEICRRFPQESSTEEAVVYHVGSVN